MSKNLPGFVFALLLVFPLASLGQEPVKPPLSPRIITATKQVTLFGGLEKQMLQAVQKKDKAAIQAMLSDECQIVMPDADPMAGEDWVDSVMEKDFALKSFTLRQVSAIDLGDSVILSYDRIQESSYKGKPDGGEFFVVDLWRKSGDSWKLASRYVSKVGDKPIMPKGPVRPTGKQ
ncbi:MAG TPA: nuclear transport factor 2 family protein [Candidatus Angelobacter sp.]|nr:nuclear transport factor 2 family protein [Candidatus Angelobacter sp.]